MKVVCAWCNELLKCDLSDQAVSHGICDQCLAEQMKEYEPTPYEQVMADPHPFDIGGEG